VPVAPTAVARVVLARTSEPPCFSVIPMPTVFPSFSVAGALRPSYAGATTRGIQSRASSGCCSSDGTHA
jgi:hypothetical protein